MSKITNFDFLTEMKNSVIPTLIYYSYFLIIDILYCWLIMVLFITTLVGILKKENNFERGHGQISVTRNYKLLWKILNLSQFKILALALLTAKVSKFVEVCYKVS